MQLQPAVQPDVLYHENLDIVYTGDVDYLGRRLTSCKMLFFLKKKKISISSSNIISFNLLCTFIILQYIWHFVES